MTSWNVKEIDPVQAVFKIYFSLNMQVYHYFQGLNN